MSHRENIIGKYLSGVLSYEEKEGFEEHLFSCDPCFEEIRVREETAKLINEERQTLFADYLESQKAEAREAVYSVSFGEKLVSLIWGKQRKLVFSTMAVAALAVTIFMVNNPFSPSPMSKLYETEPFPFLKPAIRGQDPGQRIFFEGMEYYEGQDYQRAAEKLEVALETNPELKEVRFYLGVIYYLRNDLDDALEHLIIYTTNHPNSDKGHWYLAHTYLRKGNLQESLGEFRKVAELEQEKYSQKAKDLIEGILALQAKQR
jgi:tetratricopeptide (TPR) repeat protein